MPGRHRDTTTSFRPREVGVEIDTLKQAYHENSGLTDEIEDALTQVFHHPTGASDAFFFSILDDYDPEVGSGWIKHAIMYAPHAVDRALSQQKLEGILGQPGRYWTLGALLGTVATQLGRIAPYPNPTLARTIEFQCQAETEVDQLILDLLRSAAYGAYVASATNFHTGRDAGNELRSRNIQPTLAMAEKLIAHHKTASR